MARALVPLDVIYPIVSDVVVDCVDAMHMGTEIPVSFRSPLPKNNAKMTLRSLLQTSTDVRRVVLKILADGFELELSTQGCWSLIGSPLESISTVPQAYSGADSPHIPGRPVHDCYLQYRIASDHLSQAEKRFYRLTHFTLEDGQTRRLDEPVNPTVPMHEARAAGRHLSQALEAALRAPVAFRPRLLVRAADLHGRLQAFISLRLGANDISAKLSALTASLRFGHIVSDYASDAAECLMALERALLQLKTAVFDNSGQSSLLAASRPSDEVIGTETFEALCSALRRVTTDEVLREASELARTKLINTAETWARCQASSEELLRVFEGRLQTLTLDHALQAGSPGSGSLRKSRL